MENYFNHIYELVDRSIYESLRLELVRLGYLPDITEYETPEAFEQAKQSIIKQKGFVIELFGASASFDKWSKKFPRMVYIPKRIMPGDIGGNYYGRYYEEDGEGRFIPTNQPPQWTNYQFEITIVAKKIDQLRIMDSVISNKLSRRDYVKVYNDNTQQFFIEQTGYRDWPDLDYGFLEYTYMYTAYDLVDRVGKESESISPLDKIHIEVKDKSSGIKTDNDIIIKGNS